MSTVIEETFPKARKKHVCMACDWIRNTVGSDIIEHLSFAEKRAVVKARRNNYLVVPGEHYIRQFISCCGEVYVYKAIPEIHSICINNDLYEDAC